MRHDFSPAEIALLVLVYLSSKNQSLHQCCFLGHSSSLLKKPTSESPLPQAPSGLIDFITDQGLADRVAAYGLPVEAALATYRAARPNASAGDLFAALQTDWFYRIPAIRLAEAHAKSLSATYLYEFAWPSPQYSGRLGSCHGLEIAFVFDNLDNTEFVPLLGTTPPQLVADAMHTAWVAFAACGDPGWPKYDLISRVTQRFDTTSTSIDDPRSAERALWEGLRLR